MALSDFPFFTFSVLSVLKTLIKLWKFLLATNERNFFCFLFFIPSTQHRAINSQSTSLVNLILIKLFCVRSFDGLRNCLKIIHNFLVLLSCPGVWWRNTFVEGFSFNFIILIYIVMFLKFIYILYVYERDGRFFPFTTLFRLQFHDKSRQHNKFSVTQLFAFVRFHIQSSQSEDSQRKAIGMKLEKKRKKEEKRFWENYVSEIINRWSFLTSFYGEQWDGAMERKCNIPDLLAADQITIEASATFR